MTALKKPVPFGKYYLLERINVGGMAEVFKAKTFGVEGFERLLAVKRILPNIAEDEEFITMFIDEAKIAVQLQHANIAQIFDLGKVDDSFFIALEYVNGRDLRSIFDRMRSKGESLPIALACHVMMQVCEGLDYAHNKRDGQGRELHLVHRDISPQNVLIGYEGEVKLIDFGIAKAAGKASTTQAGILKGKFGYMSPEQVRGLPIDKRSDIFAVGIVLYELLTGERLFVGETDFSTLEKVRNVEIVPPSSYNKKIPQELERLMLKALARDPEDRYQNAIDLHDDLQSFLYSVGEFYSRKDLAAWMKKTFAAEIEEDNAKLEQYRQLAAPVAASTAEVSRRAAVVGRRRGRVGARPRARRRLARTPARKDGKTRTAARPSRQSPSIGDGVGRRGARHPDLRQGADEERATRRLQADDLFFEDDERTVANEPPPDILEQARPPESGDAEAARADRARAGPSEEIKLTPPPAQRLPAARARRPTLVGVPPTPSPIADPPAGDVAAAAAGALGAAADDAGAAAPVGLQPAACSGRAQPMPSPHAAYRAADSRIRRRAAAAARRARAGPDAAAAASAVRHRQLRRGNFSDEPSRGRARGERFLGSRSCSSLAAGGSGAYWYYRTHQAGADRAHRPCRPTRRSWSTTSRSAITRPSRSSGRPGRTRCRSRATATCATIRTSSCTPVSRCR